MDKSFYKKIEDLFKNKQFENIRFEINSLDDHEKNDPFIYNILGIIESSNKNLIEAKKLFYSALKLDNNYLHSLINLANLSYLDKDFQKIINLLKEYYSKNSYNSKVNLILADMCYSAGFLEDSIYFHKKLIDNGDFENKDLAVEYANRNKLKYEIIEPNERKINKKSYADNFTKEYD